jgi:hypothetical protein
MRFVLGLLCGLILSGAVDAQSIFADGFESGQGGGDPPNLCPEDPAIAPAGWMRQNRTWVRTWSARDGDPAASYPSSVGFPVPVGADNDTYRVTEFTPNPLQSVNISWEQVQANSGQGYPKPRPGEVWFSISPCAGDFRPADDLSPNPYLRSGCRRGGRNGGLIFSSIPFESDHAKCNVIPGVTHYMNVIAANPQDGLTFGERTCDAAANSATGCDVNATHRPQ